jgi:hypothetical protein
VAVLSYIRHALGRDTQYPTGHSQLISISQGLGELSAFLQRWDEIGARGAPKLPDAWAKMDAHVEEIRKFAADFVTYTKLINSVRDMYASIWEVILTADLA